MHKINIIINSNEQALRKEILMYPRIKILIRYLFPLAIVVYFPSKLRIIMPFSPPIQDFDFPFAGGDTKW